MKLISLHKNYERSIAKAAKGNRKAQQHLFDLFSPKMLSVCRRYMKQLELAEEVMLSGFLKVFTNLDSFKNQGSFEGWIRRIMVNECISQLRKDKKIYFEQEDSIDNHLEFSSSQEGLLEAQDIQKMIDELPDGYKTVFVLYIVEGYKHSEIAELLQISEGTSKSQLSKARTHLQQLIAKQNRINNGTH